LALASLARGTPEKPSRDSIDHVPVAVLSRFEICVPPKLTNPD
jgi:hypothetical protein